MYLIEQRKKTENIFKKYWKKSTTEYSDRKKNQNIAGNWLEILIIS